MISELISIVMPAFHAEDTIGDAVRSLVAQRHQHWQLLVVADDGADYEQVLGRFGLADPRIRYLATRTPRSGASQARNVALDHARSRYCAVLDGDDRFHPEKLASTVAALAQYPIVSTALRVVSSDLAPLRTVGEGPDRVLSAGEHKWVNLSMDSTIAWDRDKCDARYDPAMPNFNDLDFLLRLWAAGGAQTFHIGVPLHEYRKLDTSLSSSGDVTERMVRAKTVLLERLSAGYYALPGADIEGLSRFLRISVEAENTYGAALKSNPQLLFEDHLEPRLRAASTSAL